MTPKAKPVLHGVLLVRKPKGWTSFDVVKKVKGLARPSKVGHAGTLDPMATGLLPVTVGEATKLTRWLSGGTKRYLARVKLGVATDTLDAEGTPSEQQPVPTLSRSQVERACEGFLGQIQQTPPMYSAVHHKGQRLYKLARAGVEVEREARQVEIHSLTLVDFEPEALELDVACSAGTYIRTLAADLSQALGTVGHLSSLVRTEAAGFHLERALDASDLTQEGLMDALLGIQQVLTRFERVDVPEGLGKRLSNGNRLDNEELLRAGVSPGDVPRVVWFCPPAGKPIILSELAEAGADPAMQILRVLHPPGP